MYVDISTLDLQPEQSALMPQLWCEQLEPLIDQLTAVVDLYLLLNPEQGVAHLCIVYASEAAARAGQQSEAYRSLQSQLAALFCAERLSHSEYAVIST